MMDVTFEIDNDSFVGLFFLLYYFSVEVAVLMHLFSEGRKQVPVQIRRNGGRVFDQHKLKTRNILLLYLVLLSRFSGRVFVERLHLTA